MFPQVHVEVHAEPPVPPLPGEPPLFAASSPQRERIHAFLLAARDAAHAYEFDGRRSDDPWRLRVVVREPDPTGTRESPDYGMAVATAVMSAVQSRGRLVSKERHFGELARFALIKDSRRIGRLLVETQAQRGRSGIYNVSLVADGPMSEMEISRDDGTVEPVRIPGHPVVPEESYKRFELALRTARSHYLRSDVKVHLNRSGGWFEFGGPAFGGKEYRFGPMVVWGPTAWLPLRESATIYLQQSDLHALWLAIREGGCLLWPPVIDVSGPRMRGEIRLVAGHAGARHRHFVTSFKEDEVRFGHPDFERPEESGGLR